jgi:hypothetical protein
MKSLLLVVLAIAACEQHSPAPVNHAEPPPPPGDGGTGVALIDGSFARGAPYCPGERPAPAGTKTCTRDEDCGPQGRCYPDGVPDYSGMCGVAPREIAKCEQDRDCGKHAYCDHRYEQHGCGEVITARCTPKCTPTSCKPGEVCRKDGFCDVQKCTDGFACQPGWTCDKAGYIHDEHGCRQPACTPTSCGPNQRCTGEYCDVKRCASSADCDCGACFNGYCKGHPGVCGPLQEPSPPP